jgi:hypothetical protein
MYSTKGYSRKQNGVAVVEVVVVVVVRILWDCQSTERDSAPCVPLGTSFPTAKPARLTHNWVLQSRVNNSDQQGEEVD